MMNSTSHSPDIQNFNSLVWRDSTVCPGVRIAVRRITLAQRIELTRRVRELTLKNEFLRCGTSDDQLAASLGDLLARRLYLEWGVGSIEGLRIDGADATPQMLAERGPEKLAGEAIQFVMDELHLSEEETKNS